MEQGALPGVAGRPVRTVADGGRARRRRGFRIGQLRRLSDSGRELRGLRRDEPVGVRLATGPDGRRSARRVLPVRHG